MSDIIEPKSKTDHLVYQKETGIKENDKVRVVSKSHSRVGFWENDWASFMDDYVMQIGKVVHVDTKRCSGIMIEFDNGCQSRFPYFVLRIVESA
jgi:hypothetical protein